MDIDIDFADRNEIISKIQHHSATLENGKKHNTGVYVTPIPHNPVDNLSTIDYKAAEDRNYFKIDFLNVSIYKDVRDEEHLEALINKEPMWDLLQYKEFTDQLFHVLGHDELMKKLKPDSIEKLAAALAIIRPAKRYLADRDWCDIFQEVWTKPADGQYYFKKAHSFSYAMAVVVHMNLICESVT